MREVVGDEEGPAGGYGKEREQAEPFEKAIVNTVCFGDAFGLISNRGTY